MEKPTRRKFLQNGAALTTASLMKPRISRGQASSRQAGEQPNILVFMSDQQQGATFLQSRPYLTPRVNRLASEGVQFTQAYRPAPHCCPSRASFQAGL